LRSFDRATSDRIPQKQVAGGYGGGVSRVGEGRVGDWQLNFLGQPLFLIRRGGGCHRVASSKFLPDLD
jgi:hypothetical protein